MLNDIPEKLCEWPPVYKTRESLRAKRPFIQITHERGLEVVIPIRKRQFNIEKILNDKRIWVEKTLRKMFQHYPQYNQTETQIELPQHIHCQAITKSWKIQYEPKIFAKKLSLKLLSTPQNIIILKGNTHDKLRCRQILKKFLMLEANRILIPWLKELSSFTKLAFNRAIIRGQSTLWGSCNIHKTISLNYKLLFLPNYLVKHVLLHELCHTKYLNHSKLFWQLLQHWDPNYDENKKALKIAGRLVPNWLS